MKIISPTIITDAEFVSSTVPEDDYLAWSSSTSYNIGDRVIVVAEHRIYEAITSNTNKPPSSNPTDWLNLGATNRWRMFDEKVGTVTSATEELTVVLEPGIINSIALINIKGSEVIITMTDPSEGVVFNQTYQLYDPIGINDWWPYFFEEIRRKTSLIVEGLPSYRNAEVSITISDGPTQEVSIGSCVVGKQFQYAKAVNYGASVGIQDYSRKERDQFGNAIIVERAFSKRARWSFLFRNTDLDALQSKLSELRAKPAVYIGTDIYSATVIYGFFKDFDIVITYPEHSECSIDIEGLT